MSANFDMSARTPLARAPIALTAASSSCWRRPVMNTDAPSAAKRLAVARPMPLVPPGTTTTLFSNLPVIFSLLDLGGEVARRVREKTDRSTLSGVDGSIEPQRSMGETIDDARPQRLR